MKQCNIASFMCIYTFAATEADTAEEQEGNNSLEQANKLVFTTSSSKALLPETSANLANNDDADYYQLTLEQAGQIEVRMSNKENTDKPVFLFNVGLDKGTYYLLISKYDGEANNTPYSLEVNIRLIRMLKKNLTMNKLKRM